MSMASTASNHGLTLARVNDWSTTLAYAQFQGMRGAQPNIDVRPLEQLADEIPKVSDHVFSHGTGDTVRQVELLRVLSGSVTRAAEPDAGLITRLGGIGEALGAVGLLRGHV